MDKKKNTKPVPKPIATVFGSEEEKTALNKIKNKAAGGRNLSMSDFILEHFRVRKAGVK